MENNELYHFGIRGMKWGIRRYQNEDGSRTEEGRRHYGYKIISPSEAIASNRMSAKSKRQIRLELKRAKKEAKAEAKRAKKEAQEQEKRAAYEKAKQEALSKGRAEDILRFRDDLTVEEKRQAYSRLQADDNLTSMANNDAKRRAQLAEQNSKWNKAVKIVGRVGQAAVMIDNTAKFYNSAAKVMNAFGDTEWPIIGEKKEKKQETRSQQLSRLYLDSEVKDLSLKEIQNLTPEKVKELDDTIARIGKISSLEQLERGKKG